MTRPEARSTRRMAFFTTTSSAPGTTILVAQTWHRVSAAGDVDEFRIVAVDGHGNRKVSPDVRTVHVPL